MDIKELKELLNTRTGRFLMAIDGNCGSGKTTLANELEKSCGIQVVHTDHFYLPFEKRSADWLEKVAGNMDLERLKGTVIDPYLRGEDLEYYSYDPHHDVVTGCFVIEADRPLLIEGSYSCHELLRDSYDLKIFLTCDGEEQLRRLRERQGGDISGFIEKWIPKEEKYFAEQEVRENCEAVIFTDK